VTSDLVGRRLGKYEIQAEIGRGGMGTVYLAYDPLLDRRVAVKVLAPHLVWEEGFVERFLREARAAARLKHPNIVTIYDVGQEGNYYYIVMEYVEGQTLSQVIKKRAMLPPAEVVALLRPLADALDYAHRQGLVHRDMKPANVMVGPAGQVTLTDFGIARAAEETRLTTTGTVVGTPEYMSPEQARGEHVDRLTDLYSLGVVAYEMLTGQTPFSGTTPQGVLYKHVFEPPPPICLLQPRLPAGVEPVLARGLAKDPTERYPTATAFVEALAEASAQIPFKEAEEPIGAISGSGSVATQASTEPPAKMPVTPPQPPTALMGSDRAVAAVPAVVEPPPKQPASGRPQQAPPAVGRPASRRQASRRVRLLVGLIVIVGIALGALLIVAMMGGQNGGDLAAVPTSTAQPWPATATQAAPPSPLPRSTTAVAASAVAPQPAPPFKCADDLGCVTIGPKEPILIAYMLVLSGPDASLGIDGQRGVEMAVGDKKEILGHPIDLVGQDTLCSAEGGQAAATKLSADPRLVAVVGTSCSSEARTAIPIMCRAGIPLISPSNTAPDLTAPDRPPEYYCYLRTAHHDRVQGKAAADFAWEELKVTRVATIHDGSLYSRALQQVFVDEFARLGGTITTQEAVKADQTDMRAVLVGIADTKPELLYYPLFISAGAAVTRQARQTPGLEQVHLMGADGLFSPDFLKAAGEPANHMLFSSPDLSGYGNRYELFLKRYQDLYGGSPIAPYHANAYDAAMMILATVEKVAVQEPDGTLHIPRRRLVQALFATGDFSGLTGELTCNELGDCANPVIAVYGVFNADPASWNPGAGPENNPRRIWP
jgi:branched-chain amino acid transport system substrate-binding protein